MKVLGEKYIGREGNDCLIYTSVVLLEFTSTHYLVISTEQYCGSWTDNDINTSTWSFNTPEEAYSKYNQVAENI